MFKKEYAALTRLSAGRNPHVPERKTAQPARTHSSSAQPSMSTNSTILCGSDMDTGGIAEFVEFAVGATQLAGVDHPLHLEGLHQLGV
jgi:hypothetical protein